MPRADDLIARCIHTIQMLAVDAVEQAHSGHPGLPLEAAAISYVLWTRYLKYNPANPAWPDRDRFVLSAGHGSALLYALLHLTGYDLPLDELRRFRQWDSRTPGHPEYGLTPGVETTTGPLGQGLGNAVGLALAEAHLAARFNRPGHAVINHRTVVIASDGDMMEGVGYEAASLAGHLRLGKLVVIYLDNGITIDGPTSLTFSDDVATRYQSFGWRVLRMDGTDVAGIDRTLGEAFASTERPTLVIARTHIGWGSPKQDTSAAHGEPLGPEAVRITKERLGWPLEPTFLVPDEVRAHFRQAILRGAAAEVAWQAQWDAYAAAYPQEAAELQAMLAGDPSTGSGQRLPPGWDADLPAFPPERPVATRVAGGQVMNALAACVPALIGGSADLAASNRTALKGLGEVKPGDYAGRNIHFGVREHAMGAVLNGLALHGLLPFGATFMVFSDYMRPAIRLAAMMGLHVIYIFTHDSIGLGEDGPTHQPAEHLAALRAIPNLTVIRPADANETAVAWRVALERRGGPTVLALTRQNVPVLDRTKLAPAEGLRRGAYVLADTPGRPDVILIATGSEVQVALGARDLLAAEGIAARVVNMPSWELFDEQPPAYRDAVLPPDVTARLAVEAGVAQGWQRYVGPAGDVVALDRFGASAPYQVLMREFGFTPEHVAGRVKSLLGR